MKKLFFTLLIAAFALTACKPSAEKYIDDLKDLVERIAEEGSEYTSEQWEEVSQEFEALIEKVQQLEGLTDEQKQEIMKLQGKFSGTMMKKGFDSLMKDADKIMKDAGSELEKAGKAIEGFLEGLGDKD
ncbi:MAG: hypothetical protein E7098_08320 [Mediterranea massiliensis]|nr:hypothetical protein [Mediterranea massiliensis]MBO5381598.1 hypothetical protein [Bacteroides sp.]MBR4047340.1 hypothetical protein [Bacteroides sp.]